jgi:medium-chain acyl-[acyl-carrier-protein] hydrolase
MDWQPTPWLWNVVPKAVVRLRLFCFPYAGNGAHAYRGWERELPEDVHVCPVQLPGRPGRLSEPAFTDMRPLVEATLAALAPFMSEPFVFFGHSMGGLLAYELARALRRSGRPLPLHLFMSGTPAPHLQKGDRHLHELPDEQFLDEIARLNGTPPEVLADAELRALVLPTLRADFAVMERYSWMPEPPLDVPITAYAGKDDATAPAGDLSAWREHSSSSFCMRLLPGDHFFLHSQRSTLLTRLAADLVAVGRCPICC